MTSKTKHYTIEYNTAGQSGGVTAWRKILSDTPPKYHNGVVTFTNIQQVGGADYHTLTIPLTLVYDILTRDYPEDEDNGAV